MPPASEALEPRCAWGGPCPLLNGNIPPELPLRLPADAGGSSALVRLIPTGTGGGRPVLHHHPTPTRKDAFRPNAVRPERPAVLPALPTDPDATMAPRAGPATDLLTPSAEPSPTVTEAGARDTTDAVRADHVLDWTLDL
ncbi:hypothetical protein HPB50_023651 [Hyalomma asiaticum]|uniref:Uncharacterized protein n=1 Tax=Hyalomma asiaticum TaxID=266040 RepID=A0ACB7T4K7_HYAAI|nr:hypothetical protein HPB50_023651 [Hyalomma asiaticum]